MSKDNIVDFSKKLEKRADAAFKAGDADLAYLLYMRAHDMAVVPVEKLRLYEKALQVLIMSSS